MQEFTDTELTEKEIKFVPEFAQDPERTYVPDSMGAPLLSTADLPTEAKIAVAGYVTVGPRNRNWGTPAEWEPFAVAVERIVSRDQPQLEKFGEREETAQSANRDRLALLARRYARKSLSMEETGRLEIVTARLRQLIPRVTVEDFEILETISRELEEIRDADRRQRTKLRMKNS